MFKKIAGLFLAATMIFSAGVITSSAAEKDESAVVAAEGSSEVGAEASSEVGAGNVIKFDVKSSGWGNVRTVYCHVWKADGTGEWPAWQGKAEKCTYDKDSMIATYDLSQTGNTISKSDGRIYCVIFSANTGMQTYNAIMSGNCIGDTLYCTGKTLENPEDSEKTCIEAAWRNNSDCGAEKKITSTGNIVGSAFPEGESNETLMATYLIAYYDDEAKMASVSGLMKQLGLKADAVMGAVNNKLTATGNTDADKIKDTVSKVLADATGEKVDKNTTKKPTGNNNNGGGASTSSSSGSVSSGQETTILFVFGGLMIAAAGVMFLARKKREI